MRYSTSNKEKHNEIVRVAIYARVSTEHEAQLYALENQVDWYDDVLKKHDNWKLIEKYIDRGITGTSAKKRPSFMKMYEDACKEKFDLVITREVSRFARNTVDTLQYTRELKKNGIEVYFVEDNIWTFDPDGELRLTIMATLAQDESRKISLRVKAGQRTSMEKGVAFQNGSILGYDYDKTKAQLVINEEQAETVKLIFNLYNSGMGVRKIQWELEQRGRKTAKGSTLWSASVICRVLKNKIYAGYMVWYKQYVPDYLEQKKINNHGEKEQFEVRGEHEPIVTLEEWERANERLNSKRCNNGGQKTKKMSTDVWAKKLRCSCGSSFNKRIWNKNPNTGKIYIGYTCYSILKSGSIQTRINKGLPIEGMCTTPSVARWKLEAMALYIFRQLSINKEQIIETAMKEVEEYIKETSGNSSEETIKKLNAEIEKIEKKNSALLDNFLEGIVSKNDYIHKKEELEKTKTELEEQLNILKLDETVDDYDTRMKLWKDSLIKTLNFEGEDEIPDCVIDTFVDYILVDNNTFIWKFKFWKKENKLSVKGNRLKTCSILDENGQYYDLCSMLHRQQLAKVINKRGIKVAEFLFDKSICTEYSHKKSSERLHYWRDSIVEIYF